MANRCEGLPNGPCPESRCDNTVRNTIYDLFLCASCDKVRSELEMNQSTDKNTKPQTRGKSTKKTLSKSTKSAAITTANLGECSERASSDAGSTKSKADRTTSVAATRNEDESSDELGEDDACPDCLLSVCNEKRRVKCDICLQSYHQRCTAMTAKIYDKFVPSVKITGWSCETCKLSARTSYDRLQTALFLSWRKNLLA